MSFHGRSPRVLTWCLLLFIVGCEYNLGPSITVTSTNTNTNTNTVDFHDLVNFVPVPNPTLPVPNTTGGMDTPLGLPPGAQGIATGLAASNPILVQQSCQAVYGEAAWKFMDLVVNTLKATDQRWGYMVKTSGQVSADVIAYRATSDDMGAWGVDIIVDLCGTPKFAWQNLGFDPNAKWTANRF